jgi:hypothetical protein
MHGELVKIPSNMIGGVGTLQARYPRIQDSSQGKEKGVHLRTATCPAAPDPASLPRWALVLPRAPRP